MNEIALNGALTINNPVITNNARSLSFAGLLFNMTGSALAEVAGAGVATTSTALSVAGMDSLGYGAFLNNDTINTITLLSGSASFASLAPGQAAILPLYPSMTLNAISRPGPSHGLDFLIGSL
jgi:hypothetical protein